MRHQNLRMRMIYVMQFEGYGRHVLGEFANGSDQTSRVGWYGSGAAAVH